MATLNVIYRIAADISSLEQHVAKGAATMARMETGATQLTRVLGGMFSVAAVVRYATSIANAADEIQRLSASTGIGTDEIQGLRAAAHAAGNTIEQVAGAINQMQRRLASGDDSAVGALQELDLSLRDLQQMSPDRQFIAIADAIASIEDPAERVRRANEIGGRQMVAILPTIRSRIEEVAAAHVTMGQDAVTAWDAGFDALAAFGVELRNVIANMLTPALTLHEQYRQSVWGIVAALQAWAQAGAQTVGLMADGRPTLPTSPTSDGLNPIVLSLAQERAAIDDLNQTLEALNETRDRAAAAQRQENDQYREYVNFVNMRKREDEAAALAVVARQIEENVELEFAMNEMYLENAAALGAYAGNVGLFTEQWVGFGTLAPGTVRNITDSGAALIDGIIDPLDALSRVLDGIQTDFAQMATVAIRAFQEIQAAWNSTDMSKGGKFATGLTVGLGAAASIAGDTLTGKTLGGAASGAATGAAIGSIVPGIGTAIGAGVGAIAGGIMGWFTSNSAKNKLDDMRQAMIDASGGWHELNSAAYAAGMTLERVLNAKTVKDYEAAMNELNAAIAFQDEAMATLRETADKYGFTLQELGPKFAAAELDEKAQELYQDFQILTGAGIDMDTVLGRMAGSINTFVQDSLAMGVAVPNAMRPMIERMIELGLLADANGNIITDLEASGISFAMTMSEGFTALIDEVRHLTDAIARGLGIAIDDAVTKVSNFPDLDARVNWIIPEIENPWAIGDQVQGFAHGTGGRYVDFGRGTLAMLHGKEKITPEGESGDDGLLAVLVGIRHDLQLQQQLLPKQLRDVLLLAS
jgi:hypothetical protein